MKGDDYLNIVRTEYEIIDSRFENAFADAFDSDFCNGSIINSSFINSGNDAIDISGTKITVKDLFINNTGDKSLSAGENSRLIADNCKINNSEIAVCSKDLSEVTISNSELKNNKIAFTAFKKKPEYGPGKIVASGVKLIENEIPFLIESSSTCIFERVKKESNDESVKDILYGVIYGKSSK